MRKTDFSIIGVVCLIPGIIVFWHGYSACMQRIINYQQRQSLCEQDIEGQIVKCPKCRTEVPKPLKDWKYGVFHVNMYKCSCGNQFREYFHKGKLRFILSAHDGSLATGKKRNGTGSKK